VNEPWARLRPAVAGAAVGVLLLVVGALLGRPDVAVLGAAPVVAATWDWRRRPSGPVHAALKPVGLSAEPGTLLGEVSVSAPTGTSAALVVVTRHRDVVREVLVHVDGTRVLPLTVRTARTGRVTLADVAAQGIGPGAASVAEGAVPATVSVMVLPDTRPLDVLPLPPRLRGLTGTHDSRRPGEGGSLRDVHPFGPGDRLRRIDWRVTARRSPRLEELYVRREHALAEVVTMLVVDSRDDVGPDPLTWRGSLVPAASDATSLDLARRAAASVAQAYLGGGDRVGLDDLAAMRRPLPPGGGRRQLDRIRQALAMTAPVGEASSRVRAPQLPSGALVVVFSTFLDDDAAAVATQWRGAGHRVLAVDVLPPLRTAHLKDRHLLALRMVRISREDRLAALADADVEVITWHDAPDRRLAQFARRAQRRVGAGAR
jgi:uncharacterized protein (DUF58 family)